MKKFYKNPFVIAFVIGALSLHVGKWLAEQRIQAPPPLLSVGEWSLIDQNGANFGSKELAGKVVIMSMFFTRCPSICPALTNAMKDVLATFPESSDFKNKIHFVSVSVDPENDSPEVLAKFMQEKGLDSERWTLLTGEKKTLYELAEEKMKLHIGEKKMLESQNGEAVYDINHLAELILLDQKGDLRGLFPTQPHGLAALERAAKLLIKNGA